MASYKYKFVSPPPSDVICPLCLDIVEEPQQFTCCGHHICKKCGDKLKQQATTAHCPMCRHSEYVTVPDKYFERNTLNKLPIWCTKGCGHMMELGQLKNHLPKCLCVQVDCPWGCGRQYQRQCIEEHKKKCPKRPFICGYCKYQSTYEVIVNKHYPTCDKYPIICPNECSGDKIERGMLQDHLDKCLFQVVECEFSHMGCQEKVRRCDLAKHLSYNSIHHTALSSKMIYESLQKMMKEKDRQLQEKDRQLQEKEIQLAKKDNELKLIVQQKDKQIQEKDAQLQDKGQQLEVKDKKLDLLLSEVRELRAENKSLLTTICSSLACSTSNPHSLSNSFSLSNPFPLSNSLSLSNPPPLSNPLIQRSDAVPTRPVCDVILLTEFRQKKDNRLVHWFSSPYFIHFNGYNSYKMCFEVDFKCDESRTLLCVYSHMMLGPYDNHLQWPFKGKVIVQLLNQLGDYHHYDYVFNYKDNDRGKRVTRGERGDHLLPQNTFLPFDQLGYNVIDNRQYLKDDCLKFKVLVPH